MQIKMHQKSKKVVIFLRHPVHGENVSSSPPLGVNLYPPSLCPYLVCPDGDNNHILVSVYLSELTFVVFECNVVEIYTLKSISNCSNAVRHGGCQSSRYGIGNVDGRIGSDCCRLGDQSFRCLRLAQTGTSRK
jgi:hypothetical protein